jgi:hypothetical protein
LAGVLIAVGLGAAAAHEQTGQAVSGRVMQRVVSVGNPASPKPPWA